MHLLVIPKREIATLNDLVPADAELVGGMFLIAQQVMKQLGYTTGLSLVFNCGIKTLDPVFHITCTCWPAVGLPGRRGDGRVC